MLCDADPIYPHLSGPHLSDADPIYLKIGNAGACARERQGRTSEAYAVRQAWPQVSTRRVVEPFNRVRTPISLSQRWELYGFERMDDTFYIYTE